MIDWLIISESSILAIIRKSSLIYIKILTSDRHWVWKVVKGWTIYKRGLHVCEGSMVSCYPLWFMIRFSVLIRDRIWIRPCDNLYMVIKRLILCCGSMFIPNNTYICCCIVLGEVRCWVKSCQKIVQSTSRNWKYIC